MPLDRSHAAAARLAEIDALQDDVLRRLDDLERRTAAILAQCLGNSALSCREQPGSQSADSHSADAQSREAA